MVACLADVLNNCIPGTFVNFFTSAKKLQLGNCCWTLSCLLVMLVTFQSCFKFVKNKI